MIDGTKIRHLREKEGLTMKELGERVGMSEPMISFLERGIRKPTVDTLKLIADVFGVTVDELYLKLE